MARAAGYRETGSRALGANVEARLALLALLVAAVALAGWLPAPNASQAAPTCPAAPGATLNALDFATTSEHGQIQAAIDCFLLPDGTNNPGKVRIPAGTYLLPEKVRVRSGIELYGDGIDKTTLKWASGAKPDNMMSNSSISKGNRDITIRDLTLQSDGRTATDCCYGLRLVQVDNVLVRGVAANNHSKDGFYLGYYVNLPASPESRTPGSRSAGRTTTAEWA
jgi:polygalacturonase